MQKKYKSTNNLSLKVIRTNNNIETFNNLNVVVSKVNKSKPKISKSFIKAPNLRVA